MEVFMVVVFLREYKPPYTYSITSDSHENALHEVVKDRLPATLLLDSWEEPQMPVVGFAVSDGKTIVAFNEACDRVVDFQAGEKIAEAMGVDYQRHPDDPGKNGELATKAVLEAIGQADHQQKRDALHREILTLKREVQVYHIFENQVRDEIVEIFRLLGRPSMDELGDDQVLHGLSVLVTDIKEGRLVGESESLSRMTQLQKDFNDERRLRRSLHEELEKTRTDAARLKFKIQDIRDDVFTLGESVGADFDRDLSDPHMEACSAIIAIAERLEQARKNDPPSLLKLAPHDGPVGRLAAAGWLAANRPPGCGLRFFSYLPEAEGGSETELTPEQVSQLLTYWVRCWQPGPDYQLELPPLQRQDGFTVNTVRWLGPDRLLVFPLREEGALRELGRALRADEERDINLVGVGTMVPWAVRTELHRQLQQVCDRLGIDIQFSGCAKAERPAPPTFDGEDLPF
jgi:hypothetical protein